MKKIQKRLKLLILIILIISAILLFFFWQNNSIVITKTDYINSRIPTDFNDMKIAHISDLHNKRFGKNQSRLLDKLRSISPDIIVITGDLIDRRKYDLDTAMEFVSGAVDIAPVYYVSGNHEAWSGKYSVIEETLIDADVNVIDNKVIEILKQDSTIYLLGLSDPDFLTSNYMEGTDVSLMIKQLDKVPSNENFKILLSHRPELFEIYCDNKIDLIFAGHAHGGQIRIPFIGGLIAPDQGMFPEYTSGYYTKNFSTMVVSRGLGNSIVPIRIFNRPEIVVVTLKSNDK